MHALPAISNDEQLDAFLQDQQAVSTALRAVAGHLGLTDPLHTPIRGSALIGLTSTEVIKVMAPHDGQLHRSEHACLTALEGQLPIVTPRVHDAGELDGWHYIRMSRLEGQELAELWPTLGTEQRLGLATQLGEVLAQLHRLTPPDELERLDWSCWRDAQLAALESTQARLGCPAELLDGLADYVRAADLSAGRTGWLHTEVMREHLLCVPIDRGWRLSGLFDFEPAWVAPVHYEFAAIGLFVSAGQAAILKEVLRAYGTEVSPTRLFAMAMLHRYAHLGWYHRRLGGPTELCELTERWFGH